MGNTPFKLKGWSPFTKKSPAKDDPHTTVAATATTKGHAAHETGPTPKGEKDALIQSLLDKDYKSLSEQDKKILGRYKSDKFQVEQAAKRQ